MKTIVYAYFAPCIMLVFLLFLIRINHLFSREQNRLFAFAAVFSIGLIVVTSVDYLISLEEGSPLWMVRRVTSFLNFACGPVIPLILIKIFSSKRISPMLYIPFAINIALSFASMFVNLVFYISPDNDYARGPLSFAPVIAFMFYIALIFFVTPSKSISAKRSELILIGSMMAVLLTTVILEIVFRFHFLNYAASAIGFSAYYLLQNINYFSKDPLTGIMNRQMFDFKFRKASESQKPMLVGLLDINDFKNINDTEGHEAGDRALVLFAETVAKSLGRSAELYRTGGDEFMLLSSLENEKEVIESLPAALEETKKNGVGFAYGLTTHRAGDDPQETLRRVDREMYADKAEMKRTLGRRAADARES